MDRIDAETRSRAMSRVKSRDTRMELTVKPVLEALGFEFHPTGIYGNPNFAHREGKVAVFLDGCFWHGCPEHYRVPENRAAFWREKVEHNRARDARVTARLESDGWRIIRVWEHDLKHLLSKKTNSKLLASKPQSRKWLLSAEDTSLSSNNLTKCSLCRFST